MVNSLILSACFLMLFGLTEVLYRSLHVPAEITRKIAHIGGGLLCLSVPLLIPSLAYVLILVALFCGVLYASARHGFLPSIHKIERKSAGGILFPLAMGIAYAGYAGTGRLSLFYVPLVILTLCDPLAYFVGTSFPVGRFSIRGNPKTASGSLAFFMAAVVITRAGIGIFEPSSISWWLCLTVALCTTLAEAVSTGGSDNLSIPLAAAFVMCVLFRQP